jgi:hypothetical protein
MATIARYDKTGVNGCFWFLFGFFIILNIPLLEEIIPIRLELFFSGRSFFASFVA